MQTASSSFSPLHFLWLCCIPAFQPQLFVFFPIYTLWGWTLNYNSRLLYYVRTCHAATIIIIIKLNIIITMINTCLLLSPSISSSFSSFASSSSFPHPQRSRGSNLYQKRCRKLFFDSASHAFPPPNGTFDFETFVIYIA